MDFSFCLKVCFHSLCTLEVSSRKRKQASFQKDLLLQKHVLPDELPKQLFCPSLGMYLSRRAEVGIECRCIAGTQLSKQGKKQGCYCSPETGNTIPLVQKEFCP